MGLIFGTMRHFWNYRIIFFTPWVASFMGTVNFGTMGPIIALKNYTMGSHFWNYGSHFLCHDVYLLFMYHGSHFWYSGACKNR